MSSFALFDTNALYVSVIFFWEGGHGKDILGFFSFLSVVTGTNFRDSSSSVVHEKKHFQKPVQKPGDATITTRTAHDGGRGGEGSLWYFGLCVVVRYEL